MSILARRLSANVSFLFPELPFLDRLAAAADAGFTCVEFLFPYDVPAERLAARLAALRLEVSVFNAPPGDWAAGERGLAALAGRQDEFRASVATALDYAAPLGARRIHVMAGLADPADPAVRATYERNIAWAADEAGGRGLQVLIEPINTGDMPGYFLRDFDHAAEVLAGLPGGGAGLQFDLYHCQKINGRVLEPLGALLPITAHMQIAGVPDRREPSPATLPLSEIFATLDAGGYEGRVGCEYRPAAETVAGLAWAHELEAALAQAGGSRP
jgi:hydroxypyruvate isomerase